MELNNVDDGVHLGLLLTWGPDREGSVEASRSVGRWPTPFPAKQDAQPPLSGFPRLLLAGALRGLWVKMEGIRHRRSRPDRE